MLALIWARRGACFYDVRVRCLAREPRILQPASSSSNVRKTPREILRFASGSVTLRACPGPPLRNVDEGARRVFPKAPDLLRSLWRSKPCPRSRT